MQNKAHFSPHQARRTGWVYPSCLLGQCIGCVDRLNEFECPFTTSWLCEPWAKSVSISGLTFPIGFNKNSNKYAPFIKERCTKKKENIINFKVLWLVRFLKARNNDIIYLKLTRVWDKGHTYLFL